MRRSGSSVSSSAATVRSSNNQGLATQRSIVNYEDKYSPRIMNQPQLEESNEQMMILQLNNPFRGEQKRKSIANQKNSNVCSKSKFENTEYSNMNNNYTEINHKTL